MVTTVQKIVTPTREQRSKALGKLNGMTNADMKCCYTSCTYCPRGSSHHSDKNVR